MTDIDPNVPAAPVAPPEPTGPVDWEARYKAEVQDRIKEREKYKPFAQTVDALDPNSKQAILDLAAAAAAGDTDAVAEWSAATYKNLTGSEIAAKIAAQQQAPATPASLAPAPAPAPAGSLSGVTPEQIAEMVRKETERAMAHTAQVQAITSELAQAGFPVESPGGQAIIAYAQKARLPIADAVTWYRNDLNEQFTRMQQAGSAAAAGIPTPAPTGSAAAPGPSGATPGEKAIARLTARQV